MKKFIIISPRNKSIYNFRGDLIKDIIKKEYEVVAIGPTDDYLDEIQKLGCRFIKVGLQKDKVSILSDIKYFCKLRKVIKNEKPDVVFSFTMKPVVYGSLAAKTCGVKRIYALVPGLGRLYASNGFKTRIVRFISKILYKFSFKCCRRVIFQNNDDINQLLKLKVIRKEKAVKVDGSGVNMERFLYSPNPLNDSFIMASRIIREKGIIEYCKAAEIVKKKYPKAKFTLLGGYDSSIGALKPDDLAYYIEKKIIDYPGEVKDVVPFYQEHMCFVLPSYYREGLPRTILEAISIGRPVITTDWTGCRDAIEDGINGFLIPIKNCEILAKKMVWMIENHNGVKKMSNTNHEKCAKIYDVNVVNKKMLSIMEI